jgi:hypothetical protein
MVCCCRILDFSLDLLCVLVDCPTRLLLQAVCCYDPQGFARLMRPQSVRSSAAHSLDRQRLSRLTNRSPAIPPKRSEILEPPSLSASLDKRALRIPWNSRAYEPRLKTWEDKWDSRFSVKFSKDNPQYPWPLREYFDVPLEFSPEFKDLEASSTLSKSRASVFSLGSRRSASTSVWSSWEKPDDYSWKKPCPVTSELNRQSHPLARKYFLPIRHS